MQPHPPRVPETLRERDLAVMLLDHPVQRGNLKPSTQDPAQAAAVGAKAKQVAAWKQVLEGPRPGMLELEAG